LHKKTNFIRPFFKNEKSPKQLKKGQKLQIWPQKAKLATLHYTGSELLLYCCVEWKLWRNNTRLAWRLLPSFIMNCQAGKLPEMFLWLGLKSVKSKIQWLAVLPSQQELRRPVRRLDEPRTTKGLEKVCVALWCFFLLLGRDCSLAASNKDQSKTGATHSYFHEVICDSSDSKLKEIGHFPAPQSWCSFI